MNTPAKKALGGRTPPKKQPEKFPLPVLSPPARRLRHGGDQLRGIVDFLSHESSDELHLPALALMGLYFGKVQQSLEQLFGQPQSAQH